MKLFRTLIYILFSTLCLSSLYSCHSSKSAVDTAKKQEKYIAVQEGPDEWANVYVPVTVTMERPMSVSFSGRATMVRDSVINISMRVLGMEVAVINITTDSVWLVDKFHKYAFAESTAHILGQHNMSIGQMQRLILGADNGEATTVTFDNPRGSEPVTVTFSDYSSTPAGELAGNVRVKAEVGKRDVDASLRWQLNKAVWNDPSRTVSFKSPTKGYTWLNSGDAMKMLKM